MVNSNHCGHKMKLQDYSNSITDDWATLGVTHIWPKRSQREGFMGISSYGGVVLV